MVRKLKNVDQVMRHCITYFDQLDEKSFANAERELKKLNPYSPEAHLLYAMRICKAVANVKKLDTLASRWDVAHSGAGDAGLIAGMSSRYYHAVYALLSNRVLVRLDAIVCEQLHKAATLKTEKARERRVNKFVDDLDDFQYNAIQPLPGQPEYLAHRKHLIATQGIQSAQTPLVQYTDPAGLINTLPRAKGNGCAKFVLVLVILAFLIFMAGCLISVLPAMFM